MFETKFVKKIKTHFMFSKFFFRRKFEIIWKSMVEPDMSQMTIKYGEEKLQFSR